MNNSSYLLFQLPTIIETMVNSFILILVMNEI
jgi:hypothetical protein